MGRNKVTIYDIAREAEVSPATVSRILKGSSTVSEEKVGRVSELIRKYNFHPSAVARALSETRTKTIGMVMADTGNPYYSSVYSACCDEAYKRGYISMLLSTQSRPEMEVSALTKLAEQRVDAIVLCGGRIDLIEPDPAFTRLLLSIRETTHIVLGSKSRYDRIYGISVDHEASMNLAMDYLVRLGHRDIGFVFTGVQYYGTKEKLESFRREMEKYGLPVREEWLIQVPGYDCGSGREGIERLLTLPEQPTALLGINDMVTAGMLQALLAHGLCVPEHYSLLSFDDTYITTLTAPQLTAVDYDYNKYAHMLIETAIDAIAEKSLPMNRYISPTLTVRSSCVTYPRREKVLG